jgi:hypothetical protein
MCITRFVLIFKGFKGLPLGLLSKYKYFNPRIDKIQNRFFFTKSRRNGSFQ